MVLYNLNSINISERKRELATLKVLGFYDREVSAYVNRENILLTVIGTAAGIVLGIALHRFVADDGGDGYADVWAGYTLVQLCVQCDS